MWMVCMCFRCNALRSVLLSPPMVHQQDTMRQVFLTKLTLMCAKLLLTLGG